MSAALTMDDLFGVWEQNVATVRALNSALKQTGHVKPDLAKDLVNHSGVGSSSSPVPLSNGVVSGLSHHHRHQQRLRLEPAHV